MNRNCSIGTQDLATMYKEDRCGIARQVKGREPRPRDGWRSGSSGDSGKQEKAAPEKKVERVKLVQLKGRIKPIRI